MRQGSAGHARSRARSRSPLIVAALVLALGASAGAQEMPELTAPVNDFAGVVDERSAANMEAMIRALQEKTGDVVVVATIETFAPAADIREHALKLFENRGRGIGAKGRENGLLVLLAVKERRVWVEVGYGLEEFITDGFAGETSRQVMVPFFRQGDYGGGLAAGVARIIGRIAQGRQVEITGVEHPKTERHAPSLSPNTLVFLVFLGIMVVNWLASIGRFNSGRRRGWGRRSTWSGWNSGIGPFGGGFGGGFGGSSGGGFGGGFGGFGGGRSGGGGGGASW